MFDEIYLTTYAANLGERDSDEEARLAAWLAGVEPPADILDAPTGFGRHALPLAKLGFHVVGVDRSGVQLSEARRIAGEVEWPKWIQADFRELPFEDESFDAVLCLFTSIGYRGEEGDRQAFGEFLRVLRPGAALVIECLHRDRLMAIFQERSWDPLADDAVLLEERRFDYLRGEIETDPHVSRSRRPPQRHLPPPRSTRRPSSCVFSPEIGFDRASTASATSRARPSRERRASSSERESPRRARSGPLPRRA